MKRTLEKQVKMKKNWNKNPIQVLIKNSAMTTNFDHFLTHLSFKCGSRVGGEIEYTTLHHFVCWMNLKFLNILF